MRKNERIEMRRRDGKRVFKGGRREKEWEGKACEEWERDIKGGGGSERERRGNEKE